MENQTAGFVGLSIAFFYIFIGFFVLAKFTVLVFRKQVDGFLCVFFFVFLAAFCFSISSIVSFLPF